MSGEAGLFERSTREFERALQRNIKGLSYFSSPVPVLGASAKDVLIERGTLRLYHYRPLVDEIYRVPVLLVMATTNRGYIFDLIPGQSLVEYLLKRGYDVFMIDWEAPRPDEKSLDMASYVLDFIPSCVERVKQTTGEPDVSVLGYCFGGVLSLLWAALHPDAGLKNLATFTTPVDYTQMPLFASWSDRRYFDVDRLVDTTKKLMWDNALMNGTMDVDGHPVDLGRITVPFLHVTAEHDHIVPTAASAPLIDMIGSADREQVTLKGGHVSLVGGPNAVRRMWPKIDDWLAEKSL